MDEKDDRNGKPGPAPDVTSELKELCLVWGPFEADVVKSFLEGHGITCLIRGRTVPFVYPFTVNGLAEFKVFVREEDFEKAKELMASLPAPDEEGGPDTSR
jgi:hypothetical protein